MLQNLVYSPIDKLQEQLVIVEIQYRSNARLFVIHTTISASILHK